MQQYAAVSVTTAGPHKGSSPSRGGGMGPPLQIRSGSFGSVPGPSLQGQKLRFGPGPPLQGDFVRRVVPRPAPTRGRGTSMYRSDEIPLQRRPSRRGRSLLRRALPSASRSRHRRSHGHPAGERRGSAGIGRKQAMDGLRSPVGAMDGGIRRCARSPHHRGSPRSQWTPALFDLAKAGIPQLGEEPEKRMRPDTYRSPAKCGCPGFSGGGRGPGRRPGRC